MFCLLTSLVVHTKLDKFSCDSFVIRFEPLKAFLSNVAVATRY